MAARRKHRYTCWGQFYLSVIYKTLPEITPWHQCTDISFYLFCVCVVCFIAFLFFFFQIIPVYYRTCFLQIVFGGNIISSYITKPFCACYIWMPCVTFWQLMQCYKLFLIVIILKLCLLIKYTFVQSIILCCLSWENIRQSSNSSQVIDFQLSDIESIRFTQLSKIGRSCMMTYMNVYYRHVVCIYQ